MKQTYEELESQLAALAAENAGLKALARGWANATDDRLFEEHGEIFHDSIDACDEELKTICPATDAFLAEVRAQGVEMAIVHIEQTICPNHETILNEFAAQIRKGVQS
ncbi:hypothetical protein D7O10_10300 [Salmonella enterica subsp. enterica serovar Braenderup]|nr:hypothetical protein [Salmonella enterica subsp. enterica serovar Braenderup]ECD3088237.1 hypothetical protein [Salmonella enterica subsp. enterica serovar Braenderup]